LFPPVTPPTLLLKVLEVGLFVPQINLSTILGTLPLLIVEPDTVLTEPVAPLVRQQAYQPGNVTLSTQPEASYIKTVPGGKKVNSVKSLANIG
jgi:hypothetical protein